MYSEISPTLNARDVHEPRYILEEVKIIGQMDNTLDNTFESANRVYDKNGWGRNPDNPSDRTRGAKTKQRLEMNKDGLVNTLTTVQKDNLLLEKKIQKVGQISSDGSEYGTVISENGLSSTLAAGTHGYCNNCIQQAYRIRKLTPKECWRLMGYTDKDFEKAAQVNSNTQLYKQAGNAIVKQVLMAIFAKMIK